MVIHLKFSMSKKAKMLSITDTLFHGTLALESLTGKINITPSGIADFNHFISLTWSIEKGKLKPEQADNSEKYLEKMLENCDSALDNRNQHDRNKNEEEMVKIKGDIEALRQKGETGDKIIETIIEQNKNFSTKFGLTQQKYIRAKQKKHGGRVQILAPMMKLVIAQLLSRDQSVSSLDVQSFATMLNMSNVHANSNILVAEQTTSAIVGAIMGEALYLTLFLM